jgi:hypothetical protein
MIVCEMESQRQDLSELCEGVGPEFKSLFNSLFAY